MNEIDKLAHELAWEETKSAIECQTCDVIEDRKKWLSLGYQAIADSIAKELHYAELRGGSSQAAPIQPIPDPTGKAEANRMKKHTYRVNPVSLWVLGGLGLWALILWRLF